MVTLAYPDFARTIGIHAIGIHTYNKEPQGTSKFSRNSLDDRLDF